MDKLVFIDYIDYSFEMTIILNTIILIITTIMIIIMAFVT